MTDGSSPPTKLADSSSLFSQLQGFNKASLRKTDTVVKTADGRELLEHKTEEGTTVVTHTCIGGYGFVPSVVEDLQVGEILPGLIMGTLKSSTVNIFVYCQYKRPNKTNLCNENCYMAFTFKMSPCVRKQTIWVPTRSDTNRTVQSEKMDRGWKFWIKKVE